MEALKYSAMAVCGAGAFVILILAIISRRPIRHILLNAALSAAALAIINLTSEFTGVHIPINSFTAFGSTVFGLPGVCGLLLLQIIM